MKKAIGIDLGTSNSVVSFKDTQVRIIRNKENEELTRSCIGLRNEEILVGRTAFQLLGNDPINTVLSVKRLMGGAIQDEMVKSMIKSPYYKYGISGLKGGTDDAVAVILGGKQFTPEQLSSLILKKLKSDAEEKLGDEVTHAVITVPAYFTEKQKNATRIAANLAGIKVQKLLAEPTAAAIAYGVDNLKPGEARTVLVYDFGGGTFDLSILNIVDGQYMEAGTGGDRWLGGDDLDRELQNYLIKRIEKQYNIDDIEDLIEGLPLKKKFRFEFQLREKIEACKIELSYAQSSQLIMDGFEDSNGEWIEIDITITRSEFENLIKPYVERTLELIDNLIREVGYDISMIDNVLLVGGTACIPLIKDMLTQKYGQSKIRLTEKPMLAVAEGAGILAHRLGDDYEPSLDTHSVIEDISYTTNHNYFIELKDEYDLIIEKQTPLPCNVTRNYKTSIGNQKVVKVGIFADVEKGKKERQTIGFFTIDEDLPSGSDIVLDITLSIDEVFEIKAYPRMNKAKSRNIVLARGNKDAKALGFLSENLEKVISGDYSESQKDYFLNSAKREIERINSLGTDDYDSSKWDEIGTAIFTSMEQAENIDDSIDTDELTVVFGRVLIGEYPDLLGPQKCQQIASLISQAQQDQDPARKMNAFIELKNITDQYPVLITLFTVKMAADRIEGSNPDEAHRMNQMHEKIVSYFREGNKEKAFELMQEAIQMRDQYGTGGFNLDASVHLRK